MLSGSWLLVVEELCFGLELVSLQVHGLIESQFPKKQLLGFIMSEGQNPLSDNWTIKDNYAFSYINE